MNEIEHHDEDGTHGGRQPQSKEEWRILGHIAAAVDLVTAERTIAADLGLAFGERQRGEDEH